MSDNESHNQIDTVYSSITEAITLGDSLHAPSLPNLPFDVISDILCRLPVKHLLQLRCVCKSWNSLISDPNFAKKHLRLSTTRNLHIVKYTPCSCKYSLTSYPLDSLFTNITTSFTEFEYFPHNFDVGLRLYSFIGSCNGIICIATYDKKSLIILWNPSIRKFWELPLFKMSNVFTPIRNSIGYGYDSFTDKYKVVVVLHYLVGDRDIPSVNMVTKTEVKVHTLGTNIWRNIQEFPFDNAPFMDDGRFVSGTINWLTDEVLNKECKNIIVSLDLANESYQKIFLPDFEAVGQYKMLTMSVLRECLCVTCSDDVWVMKEYGNKDSWTKLFTIPIIQGYLFAKSLYMFEDDQVLLKFEGILKSTLILYDSRNGTLKSSSIKEIKFPDIPEVCVESLISP